MAYVTTEEVKKVREELKKVFPKVKFSVTRHHHSTIRVNVMESPFEFDLDSRHVNQYYIDEHFKGHPAKDFLITVKEIMSRKKVTEHYDSDYGSIPNYYIDLEIGKWDVPHVTNKSIPLPELKTSTHYEDNRRITTIFIDKKIYKFDEVV